MNSRRVRYNFRAAPDVGDTASAPDVEDEASKCPVLRSLQDVPERKLPPVLSTLDLFFKDAFTSQSNLVQNDAISRTTSIGGRETLILGDAALFRDVLSDDELWPTELPTKSLLGAEGVLFLGGAKHTRVRGLMAPAFSQDGIEKYTPQLQELAIKCLDKAMTEGASGKKLTAIQIMRSLTFSIICSVVAGLKLSDEELNDTLNDYQMMENSFIGTVLPIPKSVYNLPFMPGGWGLAARQRILDRLQSNVDRAEASWKRGESLSGQGLLQELVASGLEDPSKQLTREQIGDNMLLFLLAGFDTTAALITSMIYHLDKYPIRWQAVVEEQEQIVATYGPRITAQVLRKMKVTDRFVRETLRLKAPAAQMMRVASQDTTLGDVKVPKGVNVFMPIIYINTSDPTFTTDKLLGPEATFKGAASQQQGAAVDRLKGAAGDDGDDSSLGGLFGATVFNPDRFVGVKGYGGQQMGFGYGKHYCLGQPLAMMEAKVVLAVMARGYEVKVTEKPDAWRNIPVVKPNNDLPVQVTVKSC